MSKRFKILKNNQRSVPKDLADAILKVKDLSLGVTFSLKLENHCHEKILPKNNYMAGTKSSQDYIWDNYLYNIYIDKYYVSSVDLLQNIEMDLSRPITDISLDKMKKYCQENGKILLESRYFDAATFYPSANKVIYKHPFPWTKAHKSFLTDKEKLKSGDCLNAYVKGCEKFESFNNYKDYSISWIGINHSLGSQPEVFRNSAYPSKR